MKTLHALNDTTTTTTTTVMTDHEWKKKKGYTPLVVVTALLLGRVVYTAGQIHDRNNYLVSSGTTLGSANTAASLMMSNAAEYIGPSV